MLGVDTNRATPTAGTGQARRVAGADEQPRGEDSEREIAKSGQWRPFEPAVCRTLVLHRERAVAGGDEDGGQREHRGGDAGPDGKDCHAGDEEVPGRHHSQAAELIGGRFG